MEWVAITMLICIRACTATLSPMQHNHGGFHHDPHHVQPAHHDSYSHHQTGHFNSHDPHHGGHFGHH
ncbi:hypothetical protein WR25_12577 [Diploscapter pachys]|uniref:Uncharacterized protein n=1 Tax=Diploscapter pachys TaxID=2018661 RepID=A0A2A2L776_9BILA|nr:hypothetical protein WR25_12577 [Diploscapter pachys]